MEKVLSYVIDNKILKKLILSKSTDENVLRATARLIEIKGKLCVAIETFYADGKALQKNISADDAVDYISQMMQEGFKQMNIMTTSGDCEVKISKKGKMTIIDQIKRDEITSIVPEHNRQKKYIISSDKPVDFLVELGVQDKTGRIHDKKRSKFRQINRFLETVSDIEDSIVSSDDLYILDLCCGKSYLSFAVYYYFTQLRGYKVKMDCVDLKADVIEYCSNVARKLDYSGLNFVADDIRKFNVERTPDLTISLHACDVATDIVIAKGIDSGSRVILSTPCCHHEMMGQLKPQGKALDLLLEHSIIKQKFADAATDALRCKMLEINEYEVNAIELIDPEETPKNVLIRAIKTTRSAADIEKLRNEYQAVCDMLGVKPYLLDVYKQK